MRIVSNDTATTILRHVHPAPVPSLLHPVHYDRARRRLWIMGQRCHHGATGALLAALAAGGLAAARLKPPTSLALTATAGVLMAHDWKDRSLWFHLGPDPQP